MSFLVYFYRGLCPLAASRMAHGCAPPRGCRSRLRSFLARLTARSLGRHGLTPARPPPALAVFRYPRLTTAAFLPQCTIHDQWRTDALAYESAKT